VVNVREVVTNQNQYKIDGKETILDWLKVKEILLKVGNLISKVLTLLPNMVERELLVALVKVAEEYISSEELEYQITEE